MCDSFAGSVTPWPGIHACKCGFIFILFIIHYNTSQYTLYIAYTGNGRWEIWDFMNVWQDIQADTSPHLLTAEWSKFTTLVKLDTFLIPIKNGTRAIFLMVPSPHIKYFRFRENIYQHLRYPSSLSAACQHAHLCKLNSYFILHWVKFNLFIIK